MADPFRAIRQLERFLFRAVPEQPEPTWQRDTYGNTSERRTGRSQLHDQSGELQEEEGRLIATIIYRPDSKQIEIKREGPPKELEE